MSGPEEAAPTKLEEDMDPAAREQSLYTKRHLYDLDSDDDELDFLRKDVDFEERGAVRQAVKNRQRQALHREYDRHYNVPELPEEQKAPLKEAPKKEVRLKEDRVRIDQEGDVLDSTELQIEIARLQRENKYSPQTDKYFPTAAKEQSNQELEGTNKQELRSLALKRTEQKAYAQDGSLARPNNSAQEHNQKVRKLFE